MYKTIKYFVLRDEIVRRPGNISDYKLQQIQSYLHILGSTHKSTDIGTNSLAMFLDQIKTLPITYHGNLLAKLISYAEEVQQNSR